MEKYNDSTSSQADPSDFENTALLNTQHHKQETQRRQNYIYLTLFNLFIFTLSMLSLICAVMSQKDISAYDAAKLMDEFGIFCEQEVEKRERMDRIDVKQHPQCTKSNTTTSNSNFPTRSTRRNTSVSRMMWRTRGWISRIVRKHPFTLTSHPPSHLTTQTVPDQLISPTNFPALQKPSSAMRVTNPKTGETGYRVGLEVFHQLHCLNLLRMSTYPEYYTKVWWSDTNDEPGRVRAHLGTFVHSPSPIHSRLSLLCTLWS